MIIVQIIECCLLVILGIFLGYQAFLSIVALTGNKLQEFPVTSQRKFAIIVPAHNEEKVISKTLYSLFGLIYPKSLYSVIVVADNCTDKTAEVARNLSATVLERNNELEKGKGYALRWAFDEIWKLDKEYDAIVVFDSDSLVSGNYLEVLNYYLDTGKEVIQSSDLVIPQSKAWSSESTRIGFLLYNYVKPMARRVLGLDMGLRGNGMCFTTDLLKRIPWQAWSLTEDVEYGLYLILKGVNIQFAPEAEVWAQMPTKSQNAESQRARWEMGRYSIIRRYTTKLITVAFKRRSPRYLDTLFELIAPPLVNLMLIVVLMCIANLVLALSGILSLTFFWLWTAVASFGIVHLLVGLYAAGADKEAYKSLLYIPLYALWKIKVYVKTWVNGREQKWIRTTREI